GARDHMFAILRRCYVIGSADQDQGWHAGGTGSGVEGAATGIKRDGGPEVEFVVDSTLRADGPQHAAAAVGPAKQGNMVGPHVGLLLKPPPRRIGVGHPLIVRASGTVVGGGLIADSARAIALRKQHNKAALDEQLGPFAVFARDGARGIGQTGTIVHSDNGWERSGAFGAVDNCLQGNVPVAEFDRLRTAGYRDPADKQERQREGRGMRRRAVRHMRVPVWFVRLYNTNLGSGNWGSISF